VYSRLDKSAPNNVVILAGLGLANMNLANFDKAVEFFDKALALQPTLPAIKELSRGSRVRQRSPGEIVEMTEIVKKDPDNAVVLVKLGMALAVSNRIDEAEEYFERVYALDISDPRAYVTI